jgi:hypothetical protein
MIVMRGGYSGIRQSSIILMLNNELILRGKLIHTIKDGDELACLDNQQNA